MVDLKKCCKTRVCFQKSVPIQPKTSEILPNFAKNWQLPYGSAGSASNILGGGGDAKDLFDNIEDVGYDVSESSATMAPTPDYSAKIIH